MFDSQLQPVSGAQLTISGGGVNVTAFSGADGRFSAEGVPGPSVIIKALHPVTRLRGYSSGTMTPTNGVINLNVVLIPAGAVEGTVFDVDGTTAVGAGVRVDIRESVYAQPLGTTFTDESGHYAFPLVTLRSVYVVDATALDGSRGRATLSLVQSGDEVTLPIVYLGYGTVRGTVKTAGGNTVSGALLTLKTWDGFGANTPTVTNADSFGAFEFTHVPVGSFSLEARDLITNQAGSIAGSITQHGQVVTQDIVTASYASLHGRVFRADGTTPVVDARVSASGRLDVTDANGDYRFEILPLGSYAIEVADPGTRGMAKTSATLSANGQDVEKNVQLAAQGQVLVTVMDAGGSVVPNAFVQVSVSSGTLQDSLSATAASDGTALIDHVLSGTATVRASSGALAGSVSNVAVPADALVSVTVSLEATGTVQGVVYEPDGQTPANSGTIRLQQGYQQRVASIAADGSYSFTLVPKGSYDMSVTDAQGRVRARSAAGSVTIASNGQLLVRNFTKVGLGTVRGRVIFKRRTLGAELRRERAQPEHRFRRTADGLHERRRLL
ncbi:MAG: carboxypeptidase-like regulatory domain-containing protein [Vicinamibacterales bacterium]